jgi:hypothetical protein
VKVNGNGFAAKIGDIQTRKEVKPTVMEKSLGSRSGGKHLCQDFGFDSRIG